MVTRATGQNGSTLMAIAIRPVYYWSTSGNERVEPKLLLTTVVSFEGALKLVRELNADDPGIRPTTLAIAPLSHGAGPHELCGPHFGWNRRGNASVRIPAVVVSAYRGLSRQRYLAAARTALYVATY
jgi:hypothetical protein